MGGLVVVEEAETTVEEHEPSKGAASIPPLHAYAPVVLETAANALLTSAMLGALYYLCYRHPVLYAYLTAEDHLIENATFVAAAIASALMFFGLYTRPALRRPGYFALAVATFFFAMEEISWGQRALGMSAPALIADRNLQGEFNVHNFLNPWDYLRVAVRTPFAYAGIVWFAARSSPSVARALAKLGLPIIAPRLWPFFAVPVYLVDFHRRLGPLPRFDELAEFFGALALAVLCLELVRRRGRPTRRSWDGPRANIMLIGGVGLLAGVLVASGPVGRPQRHSLVRLSQREYPKLGLYEQALAVTAYVEDHSELDIEENRMQRGVLLIAVGEHAAARSILAEELSRVEATLVDGDDPEGHLRAAVMSLALGHADDATAHAAVAGRSARALVDRESDPSRRAWGAAYQGLAALIVGDHASAERLFATASAMATDHQRRHLEAWIRLQRTRFAIIGAG